MTSPTDVLALEARIDVVHDRVLELQSRLGTIEGELREGPAIEPPLREPTAEQVEIPAVLPVEPVPALTAPLAPQPSPMAKAVAVAKPEAPVSPATRPEPKPKPEPELAPEVVLSLLDDSPIRLLAASGGVALLLGLVCLAVYAIEQDWLSPGVRFAASLMVSAGLTMAAWPLARRTHAMVAGAIGGAGLGAWIASWLVARHVHELVSGPQVFVALGAGAAACLLIADRLELRFMAILAALAACATPVLVGGQAADGLNELMLYQLALVSVAMLVDWRQRWSELPSLALVATWMMGARWVVNHGNPDNALGFMAWVTVMLVATAISAWRGLTASADAIDELDELEQGHARARLIIGGLVTWASAGWAFIDSLPTVGMGTLALAVWHLALALVLHRRAQARAAKRGVTGPAAGDGFATGLVGLAWFQALVAGPLALEDATLVWWWIAMSVAGLAWACATTTRPRLAVLGRLPTAMIVAPALAALVYCVGMEHEPWAFALGGVAAGVPLVASLLVRRSPESATTLDGSLGFGAGERPHPILALMATLIWAGFAAALGAGPFAAKLLLGMMPVVVFGAFACAQPSAVALRLAALEVTAGGCALLGGLVHTDGLSPHAASADNWGLAFVALGLGGLALGLVIRARQARERGQLEPAFDLEGFNSLGLLAVASLGLGLAFAASGLCGSLGASPAMARFGHTLAIALSGLGLLAAGLAWAEDNWRQLGLAALAAGAAKVVIFDLAGAAFVWRALSFAGIGLVLIAGAFVYSLAQRRLARPEPS